MLRKEYAKSKICWILCLKKQKVSYWTRIPKNYEIKRNTKLDEKYKKRIVELAEDKLIWDINSIKITEIINKLLKKNNIWNSKVKILTIDKTAVNKFLKKSYGKSRKVRSIFFLNNVQKKKEG